MFQLRISAIIVILFLSFVLSALLFFAVTWEEGLDERVIPVWVLLASFSVTYYISSEVRSARNRAKVVDFLTDPISEVVPDERIVVLYLRSFLLDELMVMGRVDHADRSFVNSLEGHCLFFALGEQNTFGIRMKKTPDNGWYREFQRYVEIADVVLICPYATKSTSAELRYLVESAPEKTIIVMPSKNLQFELASIMTALSDLFRYLVFRYFIAQRELPDDFPKPFRFYIGYAREVWEFSRTRFGYLIQLPSYRPDGRMITIREQAGRPHTAKQFDLDYKGVRRAVAYVAPKEKARTARELLRAVTRKEQEQGGMVPLPDVVAGAVDSRVEIEGISISTPTDSGADGASETSDGGGFFGWFSGDGGGSSGDGGGAG